MCGITDDKAMAIDVVTILKVKDKDEFNRVYEFVKPVEEENQYFDSFDQMQDFIDNLPEAEHCSWMCRHCESFATSFDAHLEKL